MKFIVKKVTADSQPLIKNERQTGFKSTVTIEIELDEMSPEKLETPLEAVNKIVANSFANG